MEDEDGEDLTPFWVKSNTNVRRRVTTTFFSFGLVVFLLLVPAVFFLFFVVPSFISVSAQIIKPISVKNSWDSLNIVLVLVAVLFGFLSRNKNEDRYNSYYDDFQASPSKQNGSQIPSTLLTPNRWYKYSHGTTEGQKSNSSNSSQWCEYSDYQAKLEHKNSFLMKNSSSYSDLPETSTTHWSSYGDYYQRRYYDDDIRVDSGRFRDTGLDRDLGQGKIHRRHRSLEGVEHLRAPQKNKTVIVDTLPSKSKEGANLPPQETEAVAVAPLGIEEKSKGESSATGRHTSSTKLDKEFLPPAEEDPPQQPPEAAEQMEFTENPEFTYERNGRQKERSNRERKTDLESRVPVSTRPQDAPSPPSPPRQRSTYRKRTSTTGRDFLNSLYNKNKKKQRQKSVDNLDPLLPETQAPLSFQVRPPSHPPPPPPAPPPPSVFQNLFISKKHKRKRTITVTLEPQAPFPSPPPPPHEPEPTTPLPTQNPQKPIKMTPFEKLEETSNSGDEFPLNRIPLAPPPPPPEAFYKIPAWKFVVQGNYVRVNSGNSSRSGSDDGESDVTPSSAGAGCATPFHPSPFCSSPDVDTKAESFITNFRAKLKLEKIHSMKKRNVGLSGLGPRPGPGPGPSQFS